MEKMFMVKVADEVPTPEEYIKNMLDCIDENGNLNIARSISEDAFCTSDGEDNRISKALNSIKAALVSTN